MEKTVSVKRLALLSFISQFAIVMFNFTLVYYLRSLSFSSAAVGAASSVCPVVYLLGCLLLPAVGKRVGIKARVTVALWGEALSVILFSLSHSLPFIYISLFLYGFFQSLLWTNVETWITTPTEERRDLTKTLTLFNLSWSSAVGISNLAGGMLVSVSYFLSFAVECAAFVIAAVIALSSPYPGTGAGKEEENGPESAPLSPYRRLAWLGIFIIYTGYSMVIVVFPQYGLDCLGFSSAASGRLLFFRGVSVCLAFLLLRRVKFWQKGKRAILVMLALFTFLTVLFCFIRSEILFSVVFVLYGAVFALGYDLSIYHSALGGGDRHMRMVIHEVLITAGTTFGSFIGSLVYEYLSFNALVLSVTVMGAIAFLISVFTSPKAIVVNPSNL